MLFNELITNTILLQLEAAYPASLPLETLKYGIEIAGFNIKKHLLRKELAYLSDKGFTCIANNELFPNRHRYKISVKGIDFLNNAKKNNNDIK